MPGRSVSFGVFVALLVFTHLLLHVAFGFGRLAPDFMAVAVLLTARRSTPWRAAVLGLGLGLLADGLAVQSFGATAVALVVVGWAGARTRDLFEGASLAFTLAYLFIGKWLADAVYLLISPPARAAAVKGALVTALPLYALVTAVAGVLALAAYRLSVGGRYAR
jgi:rod shape-determining protein MreD